MKIQRQLLVLVSSGLAAATALGLFATTPALASGGWGFGMTPGPQVVASCDSYNVIAARVEVPKGSSAGYITGRLYNDRAGTVRKPAFGMDTVHYVGTPSIGYLIFNPPVGSVAGDVFRVSLTLSSSPALTPVVGHFEFSYNCSTGGIIYSSGPTGSVLNTGYGDSHLKLVAGTDAQGNPEVEGWCVDPEGNVTTLGPVISQSELAGLPALPATNTLIEKNNSCLTPVATYVLMSGEYQVTIGPDTLGIIDEVVFSGLVPTNIHFKQYNADQQ